MAKLNDILVKVEIEPIVKLQCLNSECMYRYNGSLCCRLKHIVVGLDGACTYFTKKEDKDGNSRSNKAKA